MLCYARGGIVYGCKMETPYRAVHARAENREERNAFCGSKYIQSDMQGVYLQIEKDLRNGRTVLFSGTPCQIKAVKKYFSIKNIKDGNLILVDIACQGVPSSLIWREYLRIFEVEQKHDADWVDFRNKKEYGWHSHFDTVRYGKKTVSSMLYGFLFNHHLILRPACYNCTAKTLPYESDITLADFWGIEQVDQDFDDNRGVSLVLVNTVIGQQLIEKTDSMIERKEYPLEKVVQKPLIEPANCPSERDIFWADYFSRGMRYCLMKYAGYTKKRELLDYLPDKIVHILGRNKVVRRKHNDK